MRSVGPRDSWSWQASFSCCSIISGHRSGLDKSKTLGRATCREARRPRAFLAQSAGDHNTVVKAREYGEGGREINQHATRDNKRVWMEYRSGGYCKYQEDLQQRRQLAVNRGRE